MSRFYLDLHECGTVTPDRDGIEVAHIGEARHVALTAIRDIMSGEIKDGALCLSCHIEIRDGSQVIDTVYFRDAIAITGI